MANPDVPTVVSATGAKPAYLPAVRNASSMIYGLMQKAH